MKKAGQNKNNLILFLVFVTGACVLIIEVLATRLLAPYFGNTIFSVSSILAVVLGALSLGYYYGGKLADKNPNLATFYKIIFVSGIATLVIRIFSDQLLPIISFKISIFEGPLITSFLMFFLPCLLLGMLSPFAIRISMNGARPESAGTISGKIFFFSTAGSIFGSLLAGFYLIPNFGIRNIILGVALVLILIGVIGIISQKNNIPKNTLPLLILFALLSLIEPTKFKGTVFEKEGLYQNITILDSEKDGKKIRYLLQDRNPSAAIYLDSDEHVFGYTKYYSLYQLFSSNPENILVLGGGAYTIPHSYVTELPQVIVDVAEIEPELYDLSQKYFNVKASNRINNHIVDGRRYLTETDKQFDIIFSDVYSSLSSTPQQFSTVEFYLLAKAKLTNNGVFMANVIGDLEFKKRSFLASQIKTFKEVFPEFKLYAVEDNNSREIQNFIFVGSNKKLPNYNTQSLSQFENVVLQNLDKQEVNTNDINLSSQVVFYDDYAPTEKLIGDIFLRSF